MAVPVQPFKLKHIAVWASFAAASLAALPFMPAYQNVLGAVFLLSSTVAGYVVGTYQPTQMKAIFHPLVICTLLGNAACAVWASVAGITYESAMKFFLQTVCPSPS